MKVSELDTINPRILLIGDYGAGKTHTIGLFHEELKRRGTRGIYMFDFDHGAQTLKSAGFGDVELDLYVDEGRNVRAQAFRSFMAKFSNLEKDMDGFGGIAIDSLTTLQKAAGRYAQHINPTGKRSLEFMMSLQDWGVLIEILEQMFPQLLRVSHQSIIIMTAHLQERQNELTQTIETLPAVAGKKLPSSIGLWFNEVWYLQTSVSEDKVSCTAVTRNTRLAKARCKTQTSGIATSGPVELAVKAVMKNATVGPKPKRELTPAESAARETVAPGAASSSG